MSTLDEIQERREARKAAIDEGRTEQYLKDMAALDELEELHGYEQVHPIHLTAWKPGVATMLIVRVPTKGEHVYKRFKQRIHGEGVSAAQKVDAEEELGRSCTVYPSPKDDEALFKATADAAAGILAQAAGVVVKAVQGRTDEEGK